MSIYFISPVLLVGLFVLSDLIPSQVLQYFPNDPDNLPTKMMLRNWQATLGYSSSVSRKGQGAVASRPYYCRAELCRT
ncbi:hypothetical protein BJV74DRAFT_833690 [Russula compacta]|nr:hypothetical protein BJV74DRAFT_833690 [Russula compacta]